MGHLQEHYGCSLQPLGPGVCAECGRDHEPGQPHDAQSMHYQYSFFDRTGRWPTWADAIAHCAPDVQSFWSDALKLRGVDPEGVDVFPIAKGGQ